VSTTAGTGFKVNCYLIWDEVTREAALFDTGFEAQPIFDVIAENKLELKHLFITHTHADHVADSRSADSFVRANLISSRKRADMDVRSSILNSLRVGFATKDGTCLRLRRCYT